MWRVAEMLLQPPQLGPQLGGDTGIGRIVVDIVELVRVALEVEKLPFRRLWIVDRSGLRERVGVIVDQLVAQRPHTVVREDVVVREIRACAKS